MSEILKNIDAFGTAVVDLRKSNDKQFDELRERLEVVESLSSRPRGASNDGGTAGEKEHSKTFLAWIRRPRDHQAKNILAEAQGKIERKSVTIGTPASGGYAVPALTAKNIERRVTMLNPFRHFVEVVQVGSSDFRKLV